MPVLRDPLRTYARASRRQSAAPADLCGVFSVTGRGGTVLQPTVSFLHRQPNFPADAPLMNITDGWCEEKLLVVRDHCFVLPRKGWSEDAMPLRTSGPVFLFRMAPQNWGGGLLLQGTPHPRPALSCHAATRT